MPAWRARYPGVEDMHVAVMGCVVNGPGESKLANIGISLPGTGETPGRAGVRRRREDRDAQGRRASPRSSRRIVEDYVRATYGGEPRAAHLDAAKKTTRQRSSRRSRDVRVERTMSAEATAGRPRHERRAARRGRRCGSASRTPRARVFAQYGYRNMRVPIVEPTALFVRGIGELTDIVEKEMYTFDDELNGESLTLRPEATAGIVRAAIEHNLCYERPQRVWTAGPMFRHERPQKGRYRQFHQFDVEALGFAGPDVDAEQIVMLARLWQELGLADGIALHDQLDRRRRRAARAPRRR